MRQDGPPPQAIQDLVAMPIEVACGKCGAVIDTMRMLKSVKEVARKHGGRCPSCGQALSTTDFVVEAGER